MGQTVPHRSWRILAITDTVDQLVYSHQVKQRFGDIDLVIACGDLPPYYLEFLVSSLDRPLYYVRGNHDHEYQTGEHGQEHGPGGCTDLDGRVVIHDGLIMVGLGGSPRYNSKPDQYSDREQAWRAARLAPRLWLNRLRRGRACDLFVSHTPPRGINDGEDLVHQGFPFFRHFLERYQPRWHLHGHIHLYNRNAPYRTTYGATEVINVYPHRVLEVTVPSLPGTG